jgi:hypothetical protein
MNWNDYAPRPRMGAIKHSHPMKTNEEKNPFRCISVRIAYAEAMEAVREITDHPDDYIPEALADAKHDLELLQCLTQAQEGQEGDKEGKHCTNCHPIRECWASGSGCVDAPAQSREDIAAVLKLAADMDIFTPSSCSVAKHAAKDLLLAARPDTGKEDGERLQGLLTELRAIRVAHSEIGGRIAAAIGEAMDK